MFSALKEAAYELPNHMRLHYSTTCRWNVTTCHSRITAHQHFCVSRLIFNDFQSEFLSPTTACFIYNYQATFRGDGNVQPIIQIYFEFIGVAQHARPRIDIPEALNSVAAFSLDVLILRRYE